MVNEERLAETFKMLVGIDSVSKEEGKLAAKLKGILESLGATTWIDAAGTKIGSDTGNLIARLEGNTQAPPLLLNAHMDTVEPGRGVSAVFKDGVFTSDGTTILGADDKSAIAIIIETLRIIRENDLPHGPLEIVLTVCEEIGLLGAKHLDFSRINATCGFALDATDTEGIVTRAPSANRLEFRVHGKDAHAGAAPEKGINAIFLASKAIAGLEIGRIDQETTCNIGVIEGGTAINIVPKLVIVKGEVRSHDEAKLAAITDRIVSSFKDVVENYKEPGPVDARPRLEFRVDSDFRRTFIPDDHPVVTLARRSAENLGKQMNTKTSGGGADANIFFEKGIVTGVLGTGMRDMHTVRESVRLDDMAQTTRLLLEIIKLHSLVNAEK
ncbi:MAG: M20/M25/M40 family metallo-hydrolase [Pseudomonadota bacterium]|uniref:M20/M25/M40 family metallo-hydrolase n=1 Tax=Candidatus Desulfatibia profunda TaxID=2841695 RepID=A0A8J6NMJ1_9BACT|nr:M20/M25/M40 family metallo-hydrolase [Candidatus Desulfatibia profunda]MBL7181379.1 M20/M25/M40 family metallo-hydrolase [Desulfobacterales bacterium]